MATEEVSEPVQAVAAAVPEDVVVDEEVPDTDEAATTEPEVAETAAAARQGENEASASALPTESAAVVGE